MLCRSPQGGLRQGCCSPVARPCGCGTGLHHSPVAAAALRRSPVPQPQPSREPRSPTGGGRCALSDVVKGLSPRRDVISNTQQSEAVRGSSRRSRQSDATEGKRSGSAGHGSPRESVTGLRRQHHGLRRQRQQKETCWGCAGHGSPGGCFSDRRCLFLIKSLRCNRVSAIGVDGTMGCVARGSSCQLYS